MEILSVVGMILGVAALIYLTFKGVNGFVASIIGSIIVILTSGLSFWGTLTGMPPLWAARSALTCFSSPSARHTAS